MEIKVITVDVRLSRNTKRAIAWVLTPLAVLAGSLAVAHAAWGPGVDVTWIRSGQAVDAAKLKAIVDDADRRFTALEAGPRVEWYRIGTNGGGFDGRSESSANFQRLALGQTRITFGRPWNAPPACTARNAAGGGQRYCQGVLSTTTQVDVYCQVDTGSTGIFHEDNAYELVCVGSR
jgi:hypothetical protein